MAGTKNQSLDDEGRDNPGSAVPKPLANQGCAGDRHGTKKTFFPESCLKGNRDRGKPGEIGSQYIGMKERMGRCPPTQYSVGKEVKDHLISKKEWYQQIANSTPPQYGGRIRYSQGPRFPKLDMMGKSSTRQALSGHE